VEPIHCFCCCGVCRHRNERKSPGFVRELIENDLHFRNVPALAKEIF
jgi:hypothetical protein